jgi:hypothetical protein
VAFQISPVLLCGAPSTSGKFRVVRKSVLQGVHTIDELQILNSAGISRASFAPMRVKVSNNSEIEAWREHLFQWSSDSRHLLLIKDIPGRNARSEKWPNSEVHMLTPAKNPSTRKLFDFHGDFVRFSRKSDVIYFSNIENDSTRSFFRFVVRDSSVVSIKQPPSPDQIFSAFSISNLSDSNSAVTLDGSSVFGYTMYKEQRGLFLHKQTYSLLRSVDFDCFSSLAPYFLPGNRLVVLSLPETPNTVIFDTKSTSFFDLGVDIDFHFSADSSQGIPFYINQYGAYPERKIFPE